MSRMNFRGLHALVLHRADRDGRTLCEQLQRLGLSTQLLAPDAVIDPAGAQVCFFDVEAGHDGLFPWPRGAAPIPIVALIGSETRARLEWMLSHEPHACITKPIRSSGVYSALVIADHAFARGRRLEKDLADLNDRVRSRRLVFDALLRLMTTFGVDEAAGYRMLRTASQQRRLSIEQVSALVVGGEAPPSIDNRLAARPPRPCDSPSSEPGPDRVREPASPTIHKECIQWLFTHTRGTGEPNPPSACAASAGGGPASPIN